MSGPRVRFAPSPTGSLHLGNARTALFNWLLARKAGGTLILRIEDTDTDRHQDDSESGILEDLRWLGLDWDEGPDRDGGCGPYRQSERASAYQAAAQQLVAAGRAYRCFCDESADRDQPRGAAAVRCPCADLSTDEAAIREGDYPLRFRSFPSDHDGSPVRFVDRLRGDVEFPAETLGDPVILRKDGRATYNFAVVVDDAAMRIDLVLRGDDHLSNTPKQVQLFHALGHPLPEFAHLPMVRGEDGSRLSKRHGAVSVGEYRRAGYPVAGMLNALALMGWAPKDDQTIVDRSQMVEQFDIDRVNRSPAAFDADKLDWICNQHIQRMEVQELVEPVAAALASAGVVPPGAENDAAFANWFQGVAGLVQSSLKHFDQAPARAAAIYHPGGAVTDPESIEAVSSVDGRRVVAELARAAAESEALDLEAWRALKKGVQKATGVKGKALFHALRVTLTGATSGPELDRLIPLVSEGHGLMPDRIVSIAERARRTAEWLA